MQGNPDDLQAVIDSVSSTPITTHKDQMLFSAGSICPGFLWIDKGVVRVQITLVSGREVTLYRLSPGDACLLSTSCLMGAESYFGEGIAEEAVVGRMIAPNDFHTLVAKSETFRTCVFDTIGKRFEHLLERIEAVGGHRIDHELAKVLLVKLDTNNQVCATHVELARELGSAREVISRKLKSWQMGGHIEMNRNSIMIKNIEFLENLSSTSTA